MKIWGKARIASASALALACAFWLLCAAAFADVDGKAAGNGGGTAGEVESVIRTLPRQDYHGKTVILHSNDVNGAVEGYARMAWLKSEFERMGAETVLADTGNFSFGPIHVSRKGASAVELMNLVGYDVAALGRYELSYGYDALKQNLRMAAFPILCANAVEPTRAMAVIGREESICLPNYSYTTKSGVTIGFFGLLTPKAPINIDASQFHQIMVLRRRNIYRCVQEQINILRQSGSVIPGADIVIGLSSVGSQSEHNETGYSSLNIFSKAEGLDLILDGGSETVMTAGGNGEAVQSCGSAFAYIGVVVIDDAAKRIENHYLIAAEDLGEDAAVKEAAEILRMRFRAEYGTVFARSEVELNGEAEPGVRTEETNLGDLIADAIVWTARKELEELDVDADHLVGITNGGGIRASIPEGGVTRNHVSLAFPFSNTVSVAYVTGAELLETLEASTYCLPEYANSYPQSSGIAFTLDERIPYDEAEFYPNSKFHAPASIRRVKISQIRGQPFDPEAVYAVATNDYCAAGNGTYYLLKAARKHLHTEIPIDQAIVDYIRYGLGGIITEAMYGQPRGDHTILK